MPLVLIKLMLAFVSPVWFARYYRWFLVWIPLFTIPGLYWVTTRSVPREYMFVECYIELVLGCALLVRWFRGHKDMVSVMVLAVGLSAVPSLVNAGGHFIFSTFLLLCLIAGTGVYQMFADEMDWMQRHRVIEAAILMWVAVGVFEKIHDALQFKENVLYERSGGLWGSNHIGGILLLLVPLSGSRTVSLIGIIFLVFNFSRGIWLSLAVLTLFWGLTVSARRALQSVAALLLALVVLLALAPREFRQTALDFARERYEGMSLDVVEQNERWEIYNSALHMAKASSYVGVGPGGFYWGLSGLLHEEPNYSNAHNVYLTALAEGGVLFAASFVLFLGFLVAWSFCVSRPAFCALMAWVVYGFFSGEIYEAANVATAGDYYTLLFVAAFLMYKTRQQVGEFSMASPGLIYGTSGSTGHTAA